MTDINAVEQALWEQRRLSPTAIGLRATAALVLAFVTILLIQAAVNAFSGPDRYLIVMAGDFDDGELSASHTLRASLKKECGQALSEVSLDGRSIGFFEQNHIAANAALTAETVAARNDTLMVVGHFSSTASSKSLPVYLSQSPAIPVILTVETNPKLTDFAGATDQPVIRLWPTDKDQAESAARFALEDGEKFWVVRDSTSNPVYSNYLADAFTRHVLKQGKRVVLRSDIRSLPSPQVLREYDIDRVFFPGGWQDSLMLIHTVRDTWGDDAPMIILTDAAVDGAYSLGTYGGSDVSGIFVTHPANADEYRLVEGKDQVQVGLGKKACAQILDLISTATQSVHEHKPRLLRVFNHHSLAYARQAVVEAAIGKPAADQGFYVWSASERENAIVFNNHVRPDDQLHATVDQPDDAARMPQ